MKYIITFIFLFLFVSCEDCIDAHPSTYIDKRCLKIKDDASNKGIETGVCYKVPKGELINSSDRPRLDPDHEACKAIQAEAQKKCDALPPAGPDDIEWLSGSAFYKAGRPICPPSKK